ncbi:MAG: hypothetical protein U0521_30665 [Anaerolineae bacterium]
MFRRNRTRIVAAAAVLLLALFALPILSNQPQQPAPADTPQPTAVPPTPTPAYQPGTVVLGIGERTCALSNGDDQTMLMLGDGCADVEQRLRVPNSGTIWLSLTISGQPDVWLPLDVIAGDPAPPQLDQRGRFFGCTQASEEVCQVMVEIDQKAYRIDVPLAVGAAQQQ